MTLLRSVVIATCALALTATSYSLAKAEHWSGGMPKPAQYDIDDINAIY